MYGIPRGRGGTCPGFYITDQITDQYAPYCSELRYFVSSDYIELADYWFLQQGSNPCLSATSFCGWYSSPKYPDFLRCFSDIQARALRDVLCEAEI